MLSIWSYISHHVGKGTYSKKLPLQKVTTIIHSLRNKPWFEHSNTGSWYWNNYLDFLQNYKQSFVQNLVKQIHEKMIKRHFWKKGFQRSKTSSIKNEDSVGCAKPYVTKHFSLKVERTQNGLTRSTLRNNSSAILNVSFRELHSTCRHVFANNFTPI